MIGSDAYGSASGSSLGQLLIVPVDGSAASWRAFDVAKALAARLGADIDIVQIELDTVDADIARGEIAEQLNERGPFDVEVSARVILTTDTVGAELSSIVVTTPGALVVMAAHGKGRSAAIVGSVAEDVLHRTFGPIMLVGPHVKPDDFSGPIVATLDGSHESEAALPLATAWGIGLNAVPWLLHATAPASAGDSEVGDTVYLSRLASQVRTTTGHQVEFDELHGDAITAVCDYADRHGASLIVASSHGRSGLSRLAVGSVTSGFVRHATCPVLVFRLRHPEHSPAR